MSVGKSLVGILLRCVLVRLVQCMLNMKLETRADNLRWSGFMLSGGYSWRLFFYVEFALAMALLIAAFFFVEESAYKRKSVIAVAEPSPSGEKASATEVELRSPQAQRKTWAQQLRIWNGIDREAPFFLTMARSFTYLLVPSMFW